MIISGLALGILSSFLLLSYVFDQMSYDRYLPDSNRIYRITSDYHGMKNNLASEQLARCYYDWIGQLKVQYPQVSQLVKFNNPGMTAATANGKTFKPVNFYTADSTFFDIFKFEFVRGNRESALRTPMSIVLSQSMARKYFGKMDPVGKVLKVRDQWSNTYEYHITGVMDNVPVNTHFHPEFVARWPNKYTRGGMGYYYILLKPGANIKILKSKLGGFVSSHLKPSEASKFSLHTQSLTSIHLASHLQRELEVNGNTTQVYGLLIVALLIIVITCINYVNLAIARESSSLKELGIRKVLGAKKGEMFVQNILESTVYVFLALVLAGLLYGLSLRTMQNIMNINLTVLASVSPFLWGSFAVEIILLCLVSGGYPTLVMRNISSRTVFGSGMKSLMVPVSGSRGMFSRKILLVIQFSMAILLISSVMIVDQQMKYVSDVDMGYQPEQLVAIPNIPQEAKETYSVLKKDLINRTGVVGITTSLEVPSVKIADNCQVFTGGGWKNKNAPSFEVLPIDRDFISVMKMRLIAGNSLRKYTPANLKPHQFKSSQDMRNYFETTDRFYIINQAGVKAMGWKTPQEAIGKQVGIHLNGIDFKYGRVIGVVKNFHFTSLHTKIEPIIMFVEPIWFNNILIRIHTKDIEHTLNKIKSVWNRVNPGYPFNYEFVDNVFAKKYLSDNQFKLIISVFSAIAIIIACFGLFAVSLYTSERRIKEIGIRKVLGASKSGIVIMLTKDLTKWILLANAVAWPIAYYGMSKWLQNFAYHINIHLVIFLAAGIVTFAIAILTVSLQAIRAALANPAKSLRTE